MIVPGDSGPNLRIIGRSRSSSSDINRQDRLYLNDRSHMKRMAAVMGVLALVGASEVQAASKNFNFRCTMNTSLRACATLRVVTTPNIGGGTDVTIFVRN